MANTFKPLMSNDITQTRSLVYENIPIDGAILFGTYGTYPADTNVSNPYHGMFQQIYDYPTTSSSANHVFDITLGVHSDSYVQETTPASAGSPYTDWTASYDGYLEGGGTDTYKAKKNAIYNMLAQRLVGYGPTGDILKFDKDGDFHSTTTDKYEEVIALNFSRLFVKDEIKKGSFELKLNMNPYGYTQAFGSAPSAPDDQFDWAGAGAQDSELKITDYGAATSYKVNSPAGEYAILYVEDSDATKGIAGADDGIIDGAVLGSSQRVACGLIYYQAGIVILTPWLFTVYKAAYSGYGYLNDGGSLTTTSGFYMLYDSTGDYSVPSDPANDTAGNDHEFYDIMEILRGYELPSGAGTNDTNISITDLADALRQRIESVSFNNTTEVNSTIYFCRAAHNDFNYSSNPTYTDASKIVVKDTSNDQPVTYVTGIGLYSADNELLATCKLSEPIKKTPSSDLSLRARLDF